MFKRIFFGLVYLPANIFAGLTKLVLGSDEKNEKGSTKANPGLFGLILGGLSYMARGVGNFVSNHRTAIATAFWTSLAIGGAAALTVGLWPAALAAVVGFSVYGTTIASLVGTGFAAQVGAVGVVAAIATSLNVYVAATVVNAFNAVRGWFAGRKAAPSAAQADVYVPETTTDAPVNTSASAMSQLGGPVESSTNVVAFQPAVKATSAPEASPAVKASSAPEATPVVEVKADDELDNVVPSASMGS